jgi:uncharacterized protein YndB with AHSA1/START domain
MSLHSGIVENFACADGMRCFVTLAEPREKVFAAFRHDILSWWPRDLTWSGDTIEDIYFEGRKGGLLWERGPDGFRLDMARVLRWVAPERVILRWHVGPGRVPEPDPARASEVEIHFSVEESGGTRVELEHRLFSRHGAGAEAYRSQMGSQSGWPKILKSFADHCGPRIEAVPAPAAATPLRLVPDFVA